MKIAILGAGSWGTALAAVLNRNRHEAIIWARRQDVVDEIATRHTNQRYLSDASLPPELHATTDLEAAVSSAELVVFVVPSACMAEIVNRVAPYLGEGALLAHAVKGFDLRTKRRMSQLIRDTLRQSHHDLCVITGPSHAEEVIAGLPTTLVVASQSRVAAEKLQDVLMNQYLRVYTNPDVIGAELGGCLKNIIALGVGIADGLGFGDNAKAALMTRGLAEIARLGVKMGASPWTFSGLSGIGDLIVTCTSHHSRNFRAGRAIGEGLTVEDAVAKVGMVVEGIPATKAACQLAEDYKVDLPIASVLYDVLFRSKQPKDAVEELMGRERCHEIEEVARDQLPPKW